MSLKKSPIKTPEDMIGKKIGVQATNEAVWAAFLKANDIDPSKITKVPVQFDPTPLAKGEVDGWFSFFTNEPNLLKLQGVRTPYFLLADYKYPLVSETYVGEERHARRATARSSRRSSWPRSWAGTRTSRTRCSARRSRPRSTARTSKLTVEGADARVEGREHA